MRNCTSWFILQLVHNSRRIKHVAVKWGVLLMLGLFPAVFAFAGYKINIDLQHNQGNRVAVQVESPQLQQNYAIYHIPVNREPNPAAKLTDWISELAAYDSNGKHLKYELLDNSSVMIYEVNNYVRLEYFVTENEKNGGNKATLSHIQPDNRFFLLNRNGFFGYFEGYETEPVELVIHKPKELFGATNLQRQNSTDTLDVFTKPPQSLLHENLIMYALPDTFRFTVMGSSFTIAVFSETGAHKARDLYYILKPVVQGVSRFWAPNSGNNKPGTDTAGVALPVKQYTFLFYFTKNDRSSALNMNDYGGLMCSATSSFYALPEINYSPNLYRLLQRMAAHELMHLFLPNLLHTNLSERPLGNEKMQTRHLWLYEGVTEYFALLVLLQNGLMEEADFWEEISKKAGAAQQYPALSMTEASQNLGRKSKYNLWYANFYYRGALAALLLDIQLAEDTQNNGNLRIILSGLMNLPDGKVYPDEILLDTIMAKCGKQAATFIQQYIAGKENLPYSRILAAIGMNYYPEITEPFATFGQFWVVPNYKAKAMQFRNIGKEPFGLQEGDLLAALNDDPVTIGNFNQYKHLIYRPNIDQPLQITIRRQRLGQSFTFSATPYVTPKTTQHAIRQTKNATAKALQRKAWVLYERAEE
ncbi:hypothetical protein C7N43_03380 [Sphingobacteriales bacterium UPWRP_1]|nr:hypothetical protein BVG80_08780 [Sphingobacteriales bacterium TSM_CSM]PSJ78520.1 hypothetical protein C7N43_03380 [Sphingobacteriales bacterium UPWRP_1]